MDKDLGRVLLLDKGEYSDKVTYEILDSVMYNKVRYFSKTDDNRGNTPAEDSEFWAVLAYRGEVGPATLDVIDNLESESDTAALSANMGRALNSVLAKKQDSDKLSKVATSGNYTDVSNKPSINGVPLSGNKTTADLNIDIPSTKDFIGNPIFKSANQLLKYNGTDWVAVDAPNLSKYILDPDSKSADQVLTYDGENWVAADPQGGGSADTENIDLISNINTSHWRKYMGTTGYLVAHKTGNVVTINGMLECVTAGKRILVLPDGLKPGFSNSDENFVGVGFSATTSANNALFPVTINHNNELYIRLATTNNAYVFSICYTV